jgi:hypothetical protein
MLTKLCCDQITPMNRRGTGYQQYVSSKRQTVTLLLKRKWPETSMINNQSLHRIKIIIHHKQLTIQIYIENKKTVCTQTVSCQCHTFTFHSSTTSTIQSYQDRSVELNHKKNPHSEVWCFMTVVTDAIRHYHNYRCQHQHFRNHTWGVLNLVSKSELTLHLGTQHYWNC